MSLLTNAQNTLIQGATFNAIVHGDVHHHSGSQLSVIRRTQRGAWAMLLIPYFMHISDLED